MEFIENVPDHVLAMRVDKVMTAQDVAAAVHAIDDKLETHPTIGLFADVTGFGIMTPGALLEDMAAQLRYFGKWHRFPKVALVVEDGLLKTTARLVAGFVPQVEIRIFEPQQRQEALAFAASASQEPASQRG